MTLANREQLTAKSVIALANSSLAHHSGRNLGGACRGNGGDSAEPKEMLCKVWRVVVREGDWHGKFER
jgi:hypothetical protein